MSVERDGAVLRCHAGRGEWFNRPERGAWDMAEDAAPRPPSAWHLEVEQALEAQTSPPAVLVVDVTEVWDLVAHDLGFLLRVQERAATGGTRLSVLASKRVLRQCEALGLPLDVRVPSQES